VTPYKEFDYTLKNMSPPFKGIVLPIKGIELPLKGIVLLFKGMQHLKTYNIIMTNNRSNVNPIRIGGGLEIFF